MQQKPHRTGGLCSIRPPLSLGGQELQVALKNRNIPGGQSNKEKQRTALPGAGDRAPRAHQQAGSEDPSHRRRFVSTNEDRGRNKIPKPVQAYALQLGEWHDQKHNG